MAGPQNLDDTSRQSVCAATYIKHAMSSNAHLMTVHCPMQSANNGLQHVSVHLVSRPFVCVAVLSCSATTCNIFLYIWSVSLLSQSVLCLCCLLSATTCNIFLHIWSVGLLSTLSSFSNDLQHISEDLLCQSFIPVVFFHHPHQRMRHEHYTVNTTSSRAHYCYFVSACYLTKAMLTSLC